MEGLALPGGAAEGLALLASQPALLYDVTPGSLAGRIDQLASAFQVRARPAPSTLVPIAVPKSCA